LNTRRSETSSLPRTCTTATRLLIGLKGFPDPSPLGCSCLRLALLRPFEAVILLLQLLQSLYGIGLHATVTLSSAVEGSLAYAQRSRERRGYKHQCLYLADLRNSYTADSLEQGSGTGAQSQLFGELNSPFPPRAKPMSASILCACSVLWA